jgi:hypothetical protein
MVFYSCHSCNSWLTLTLSAVRAFAAECKLYRLGFEFRISCGALEDVRGNIHLDIDQFSTNGADRVVVPVRRPVKAAGAVAKFYLGDVTGLFEITKRVINGRKADARQKRFGCRKNFVRRRMSIRITNNSQHHLTLPRQTQILNILHN